LYKEVQQFFDHVRASTGFLVGSLIFGLICILALFAPFIAPYGPEQANPSDFLQAPSTTHWLGTDSYGMDILSRILWAARLDVLIALVATSVSLLVGAPLGVWAGYFDSTRGWQARGSQLLQRVMDVLQAFPAFVLAMALVAASGPSVQNVIIVITFINVPVFMRLTRSAALTVREKPYMEAARCVGNADARLVLLHLLPNATGPALINASVVMGFSVLLTAGLSFVGAGIRVPTAEWGSMISLGAQNMVTGEWWISVFPGLALGVTVLSLGLVGDALRAYLDPTRRV
jgi:peptide/nickel transport system permease protein